jgi:CRP/FNR family cyclic AMP-dependent transcriptional regulator
MRKILFILGDLTDRDVDWLAESGRQRNFGAGEVMIEEGHAVSHIFIVLEGRFSVRVGNGGELASLQKGEIVGELSFLDSRPPNATVQAAQTSSVLAIPRDVLSEKLSRDPDFAARFYRALGVFLASRLRQTMGRMGFGESGSIADEDASDELDPDLLDQTSLAAARFENLLARFRG